MKLQEDKRYVYGACCAWHGSIYEVATIPFEGETIKGGIPCCPHCNGPLFEMSSKEEWDKGVEEYTINHSFPEYPELLKFWKNHCKLSFHEAKERFKKELQ